MSIKTVEELKTELRGHQIFLQDTQDIIFKIVEGIAEKTLYQSVLNKRKEAREKISQLEIDILNLENGGEEKILEKENLRKLENYSSQSKEILDKYVKNSILQTADFTSEEYSILAKAQCFPEWQPDTQYTQGQRVQFNGVVYSILQPVIVSIESQTPGSEGMLAIYSPLFSLETDTNNGTIDDPIPFIEGMTTEEGKYYSYEGKIYLCKLTIIACVYLPGTENLWQFEYIQDTE